MIGGNRLCGGERSYMGLGFDDLFGRIAHLAQPSGLRLLRPQNDGGPLSPAKYRGLAAAEATARAVLAANQNGPYKQCSPLGLLLVIFFGLLSASFVLWTGSKLGHVLLHRIKPLHTRQPAALQFAELTFTCCHHQHVRISLSLPHVEAKR